MNLCRSAALQEVLPPVKLPCICLLACLLAVKQVLYMPSRMQEMQIGLQETVTRVSRVQLTCLPLSCGGSSAAAAGFAAGRAAGACLLAFRRLLAPARNEWPVTDVNGRFAPPDNCCFAFLQDQGHVAVRRGHKSYTYDCTAASAPATVADKPELM